MGIIPRIAARGQYSVFCASGVPDWQLQQWQAMVSAWLSGDALPDGQILGHDFVYRIRTQTHLIVAKRVIERGAKALLTLAGIRQPALLRAFTMGTSALSQGLSTPEPLALFMTRGLARPEAVLITSFATGAHPHDLLADPAFAPQTMLEQLGTEIARWHACGLRNRDLKGPNILYDSLQQQVHIIDLAGVHQCLPVPSTLIRAKDLGRLKASLMGSGLSEAFWQNLLTAYLGESHDRGIDLPATESFDKAIHAHALKKIHVNDTRGESA